MSRVLFFINPFYGHINPNMPIIRDLIKMGEEIIFYTTHHFREHLPENVPVKLYPSKDLFKWGIEEQVTEINTGLQKILLYYERDFGPIYQTLYKFAKGELEVHRPDYIVYDYFDASWAKRAAEDLNLLHISSSPTYAICKEAFLKNPEEFVRYVWRIPMDRSVFKDEKTIKTFALTIEKCICRKYRLKSFSLFENGNSKYLNLIHTSKEIQPYSTLFNDSFRFIGYEHYREITPIKHPSKKKKIYISLGSTVRSKDIDFFMICVKSLKYSTAHIVMSIGPYLEKSEFDHMELKNFTIINFANQVEELSKADLFITHAGHNSVNDALLLGVPMICIPIQTDQFIVSKQISENGAGITLSRAELNEELLWKAVNQIFNQDSYKSSSIKLGQTLKRKGKYNKGALEIIKFKERNGI